MPPDCRHDGTNCRHAQLHHGARFAFSCGTVPNRPTRASPILPRPSRRVAIFSPKRVRALLALERRFYACPDNRSPGSWRPELDCDLPPVSCGPAAVCVRFSHPVGQKPPTVDICSASTNSTHSRKSRRRLDGRAGGCTVRARIYVDELRVCRRAPLEAARGILLNCLIKKPDSV
jgi:hypothetical protein